VPQTNLDNSFNLRTKLGVTPQYLIDDVPLSSGIPVIVEVSANFNITVDDNYVSSTGTNTLTLPLLANAVRPVTINSISGTITVDGNGSSITGSATITTGVARKYLPVAAGWVEIT